VEAVAQDTDDPRRVLVRISVEPGPLQRIEERRILVSPARFHPELGRVLDGLRVRVGDRQDHARITRAIDDLVERLVAAGFYEARASFRVPRPGVVEVLVESGRLFRVRIEGNETFGADELSDQLDLVKLREPKPDLLEPILRRFYVSQGFLDASVRFLRLDSADGLESELYGWIREGRRFGVESRLFPCQLGGRKESDLEDEADGVLSEQFPEVTIVEPPSSASLDAALTGRIDSRAPAPLPGQPWQSYSDAAYQAVRAHLEDLYRSEGYLDAEVGPITLARRSCERGSPPGTCRVSGPRPLPVVDCAAGPAGDARRDIVQTCVPDASRGVRCEESGTVVMPVHAGRQTVLYDIHIEGNAHFTERRILDATELALGEPVRHVEIERALRTIRDLYAEDAYAFAQIDSELELSPDRTRARLVIGITEREPVRISRIEIRGAEKTREGLIRGRLALEAGGEYRKGSVERSQMYVESLGTFTSVSIGLEDPGIPARDKVVVVTVSERPQQYLDVKGGFSTGEGFRVAFEYGHRNLGGEAIQLTLRSQLAIRPLILIFEDDVRAKYAQLEQEKGLIALLERRNTITLAFPEIGLGPLFRFEVEGLDAHTNQRDFAQTRDAGILRLLFRPDRPFLYQLGATVELNNADIFSRQSLAGVVRVPEGQSVAVTQNLTASWDRRDRALSARRGTFVSGAVEHVTAVPLDATRDCKNPTTDPLEASCSELLRYSGRLAGYVPLSKKGLTWALSVRSGVIQHLTDFSRTYPDRLFFLGGVDSIRAYPQDSLVPEDVAQTLLDPASGVTIQDIALRGGDFFFNPRTELRIPLTGSLQTVVFLDAGNLWADESRIDLLHLRYAVGSGLRIDTPVGPLVFDYGFNVDRVLDALFPERVNQRTWEQLGAFHFAIGLF
ncbi:MAG TPA: POTRA domain-containing protein, partial [Polyangiaceae bacterium]|nr:POTRA domain-containing protein [Polyangiaceae bacterium]